MLLVTGTNGKTTTVRLLAAMVDASEQMAGVTSTDQIEVGGELIEHGDFSGPGGARTLLRDRRVEVATWRRLAADCCGGGSPSIVPPPPWSPTSPPIIWASSGFSTCRRSPPPSWWSPAPSGRRGGSCSTPTTPN